MDVKGHSKVCGECRKEVAVENLALHESHCGRFLCLCPDCDETVPKTELEQHRLVEHAQVYCSECNQQMESRLLMDHKFQECVARLMSCQFCDLELPFKTLEEHQSACGSRTERCRVCERYILLRDLAQHGNTCSAAAGTAGVPPPSFRQAGPPRTTTMMHDKSDVIGVKCMAYFPAEDIEKHELGYAIDGCSQDEEDEEEDEGEEERGASAIKVPRAPQKAEEGYQEQVHPCSYCQLLLPQVTLRWHEPKCKIHVIMK